MRPVSIPIAAALAGAAVRAAASGPSHVYNLDGSLADAWGGAALTLVVTPTLGPTGVDFVAGQGLRYRARISRTKTSFRSRSTSGSTN